MAHAVQEERRAVTRVASESQNATRHVMKGRAMAEKILAEYNRRGRPKITIAVEQDMIAALGCSRTKLFDTIKAIKSESET